MVQYIKPKHLEKEDKIGIVSPSAPLAGLVPHRVKRGVKNLEAFGFQVELGKNSKKITDYTAGSPQERAEDINSFIYDDNIKGIFTFIGGNHSNQILEHIDFKAMKKTPKIFLGYSDATVLHFAFLAKSNVVTFYGPAVLSQFAENPEILSYTKKYLQKALMNNTPIGKIAPSKQWTDEILNWFDGSDNKRPRNLKENKGWRWIKEGKAKGSLLGGCLSSLIHLRGTKYWPDFSDKILFLETAEGEKNTKGKSIADVDSYLTDLKLSGVFDQINGIIIGRPFKYGPKKIREFLKLIKRQTKNYHFPILFGVDIGHTDPMITIPLGMLTSLNSDKNEFIIKESGVL